MNASEPSVQQAANQGSSTLSLILLRRIASLPPNRWQTEALRLFREFERTRKGIHLRAFVRHCKGIEERLGSPLDVLALPK